MAAAEVVISQATRAAFVALDPTERLALFERVVATTASDPRVLRPEVARQRRELAKAGLCVPASYGRCVDVSRAWATLLDDGADALRIEERRAHPALGERSLMHVFLELDGERVDPTASQLALYGAVTRGALPFRIEPTGQARKHRLRLPDGTTRRLALADRVTLETSVAALYGRNAGPRSSPSSADITDPGVFTPIVRVPGGWVKRDDLFVCNGARGAKARSVLVLARAAQAAGVGLVVAGSRASPMISRVARVCEEVGIPCRFHVGRSHQFSPEEQDAVAHGGEMVKHADCPYLRVILPRAEEDARARGWHYVPFGVDCETHALELARQVPSELPVDVRRVVITVGSGMALAGLLRGLPPTVPILGVRVSDKPVDALLDRRAPVDWRARVRFEQAPERYETLIPDALHHGIPLDPQYEAKALRFVDEGDLFWIIARRYDGR